MMTHRLAFAAAATLAVSDAAFAQSLDARVANAPGPVAFEYVTRATVCGTGTSINVSDDASPGRTARTRRNGVTIGTRYQGDTDRCETGPARVVLQRGSGGIADVTTTVGGRAQRVETELGVVSPEEAARYLLTLAPRLPGRAADNAIIGAVIGDGVDVWRRLLEIARDNGATESSRKAAVFWVSQEASAIATAGLSDVASDDDAQTSVRSDALFFLAQRPNGEGIPALIRVVRESREMKLKKDAIWHLAQSRDSRALALFEQLLSGR